MSSHGILSVVASQRLSDLGTVPSLGEWFDALLARMNGGDPLVQRFDPDEAILQMPGRPNA